MSPIAVFDDIALLTGLRTLRLRYLDITDAGLGGLAKLAKLESLDLSSTEITDAGLKQIAALTNLRELYLNYTGIGNAGLAALKPLQQLQRIELIHTRANERGHRLGSRPEEPASRQARLHVARRSRLWCFSRIFRGCAS